MDINQIINKLSQRLSAKRFTHSLNVGTTAVQLAIRFNCDTEKAQIAGILHDCAREIPVYDMLKKAQSFGIAIDEVSAIEHVLLHAPLGAYLAQTEYGVRDEEICMAIERHTVGGKGLSKLAKIIYLADVIEPGRNFAGVDSIRALAEKDLDNALLAAYAHTLEYLLKLNNLIHPDSIAGRNELLKITRKQNSGS